MLVNGRDCTIVIKTEHREIDVPYSDETIREAVSILQEEAAIEGDGIYRGILKNSGVTGCVVTPLTIGTAPLLLYLAMGACGKPLFVSETRNIYKYELNLLPLEDTDSFDLIQDRASNKERKLYEGCRIKGFELRVLRGGAVKLKLDIKSEIPPVVCSYKESFEKERGERFDSDNVTYKINGDEYKNIYGITLVSKKQGGTKTEIWIKRAIENNSEFPAVIKDMVITAKLLRTHYEYSYFGMFCITLERLVMISDETNINAVDTVIGPLRFYVAGTVHTEVFTSGEETMP